MTNFILFGVNHKTAPLAIRERLSFSQDQSLDLLSQILATKTLKESAVLSTCNRTEIYGVTEALGQAHETLKTQLQNCLGETLDHYAYQKHNQEAVEHLFAVTASLDSMVVGENQISGQVKQSFHMAQAAKFTGPFLNQLFHRAFYVAKRVKSETKIGEKQVSLGSVAVMLAKKIFGKDLNCKIAVLGAGEIGKTVLQSLKSEVPFQNITLVNRTFEKALAWQNLNLGNARRLEELDDVLNTTDVLITSVAKDFQKFHQPGFFENLMKMRKNRTLFLIDLGMPRNIPQSVENLENIYLYNLDDLQEIAQNNKKFREDQVVEAKNIIDEETKAFYNHISDRISLPMIAELGKKFEKIRQDEWQKSLSRLQHLEDQDKMAIQQMTQAITRKILHDPIFQIKKDEDLKKPAVLKVIEKIFRLNDEEET